MRPIPKGWCGTTVFVGCGFAAKYLQGGGNFSVPLQWMKGLVRLGLDAVWLELMPSTADPVNDLKHIHAFERRLHEHDLAGRYCLLHQKTNSDVHELDQMECHGLSREMLMNRLKGASVLLNLSHSIHPPFIDRFEKRIYCDIDPGEISYWMARMEMGQSYHHEFWTIGLNIHSPDCKLPQTSVHWKTFYPLVDTELIQSKGRPIGSRFTTVGQWYWHHGIEMNGEYPDLSKKAAFEKFINLPSLVPEFELELAMNLNEDDPEIQRIRRFGWEWVAPHQIANTPQSYRDYIAGSLAEFTVCKKVDVLWRTGWSSDRAATYLATGRPVITEDTGTRSYLPGESGFFWVEDSKQAADAMRRIHQDWEIVSRQARSCAVEIFDSAKNLRKILDL